MGDLTGSTEAAPGGTSEPPHPSHGCAVPPIARGVKWPPNPPKSHSAAYLGVCSTRCLLQHLTQGDKELAGVAGHRRESRAWRDTDSERMSASEGPQDQAASTKWNHLVGGRQSTPLLAALSSTWVGLCPSRTPTSKDGSNLRPRATISLQVGAQGDRLQEVAAHQSLWSSPGSGAPTLLLAEGSWLSLQVPSSLDAFIKNLEGSQLFKGFKISH